MLKIGFIGIGSSVYYSKEYHVYDNSLIALKLLVGKEFLIIEGGQIESREEAKIAISNLKNASVDYLLVQHSGFSMGDILLELDSCNIPFYNWAVEEPIENCDIKLHSLVSLNLYASSDMKFKTNNNYLGWFYGNPTNKIFISKFLKELSYIKNSIKLQNRNIGIIGESAPTFDNLRIDEDKLKKFNLNIIHITENEASNYMDDANEDDIKFYLGKIQGSSDNIQCNEESLYRSAKVAAGLSNIIKEYDLASLAAPCWPFFQDRYSIVPCVAFTVLSDELLVPIACEGDAGGALSMMILKSISPIVPTVMDLTKISDDGESLLLWHCGISSMDLFPSKEGVSIINHPMMNRKDDKALKYGCSYNCYFKEGPVTIMRLSGDGSSMFILSGMIKKSDKQGFLGTRGYISSLNQVGKKYSALDALQTIIDNAVEHHLVLINDDVEHELISYCRQNGIKVIKMEQM